MIPLSKNPPSRYPARSIHEAAAPWWVVKVKPRQEKALAADLIEREVEYYLPLFTRVTRRADNNKPRKSVVCLFPGYICISAPAEKLRQLYTTGRVVNLVEVLYQKRFINELEQVYRALEMGIPIEPLDESYVYTPGTPVRIAYGSLSGIEGTIIKVKTGNKLILSVEGLGRAALTVTADMVQPIAE